MILPSYSSNYLISKDFAIIYDQLEFNIYLIDDSDKLEIIKKIVNGLDENDLLDDKTSAFIEELVNLNLVISVTHPSFYRDSFSIGGIYTRLISDISKSYHLKELSLEISQTCDLNCTHCHETPIYSCQKCTCLNSKNQVTLSMNISRIKNLIEQAIYFQCDSIRLIGGNPFLNYDVLNHLVVHIRTISKTIPIFIETNGLLLLKSERYLLWVKKYDITLNIQIVHDTKEYQTLIDMLEEHEVNFYLTTPIFNLQKHANHHVYYNPPINDAIRQSGTLINKENLMSHDLLNNSNESSFINLCMNRMLFIDYEGNCFPCRGWKNVEANITNDFGDIYQRVESIWRNRSHDLDKCHSCKAKSFCLSCVVAKGLIKNEDNLCNLQIQIVT